MTKDVIILILLIAQVISILGLFVTYFCYLEYECNNVSPPSAFGVLLNPQNYSNMILWPEAAGLVLEGDKGEQLYLSSYYSEEIVYDFIRINNHTYYLPGYVRRNKLNSSYGFFDGFIWSLYTDDKTAIKVRLFLEITKNLIELKVVSITTEDFTCRFPI